MWRVVVVACGSVRGGGLHAACGACGSVRQRGVLGFVGVRCVRLVFLRRPCVRAVCANVRLGCGVGAGVYSLICVALSQVVLLLVLRTAGLLRFSEMSRRGWLTHPWYVYLQVCFVPHKNSKFFLHQRCMIKVILLRMQCGGVILQIALWREIPGGSVMVRVPS